MERISSRENERVKWAVKLASSPAFRAEEGLFFAEGRRLCEDLADRLPVRAAFFTEDFLRTAPKFATIAQQNYLINTPVDDKLAQTKTPQGVYCVFETPRGEMEQMDVHAGILVCETLQNPANVGAVLRSAAAFGFGGVVLLPGSADPFAPKALRASMGAVGRIPVVAGQPLQAVVAFLHAGGAMLYAAALENAQPVGEVQPHRPFALLLGNEGAGLSAEALALADAGVYIPMQNGMESLNAAVAASVLMFHFSARGQGQNGEDTTG